MAGFQLEFNLACQFLVTKLAFCICKNIFIALYGASFDYNAAFIMQKFDMHTDFQLFESNHTTLALTFADIVLVLLLSSFSSTESMISYPDQETYWIFAPPQVCTYLKRRHQLLNYQCHSYRLLTIFSFPFPFLSQVVGARSQSKTCLLVVKS